MCTTILVEQVPASPQGIHAFFGAAKGSFTFRYLVFKKGKNDETNSALPVFPPFPSRPSVSTRCSADRLKLELELGKRAIPMINRHIFGIYGNGDFLMKQKTQETPRKFAQVSLSAEFAADVRLQADSADRSMAAQLEHWAKLGKALETVIPAATLTELKSGKDAAEVLSRVGAFLTAQHPALLMAKLATAKSPVFGVDEVDPEVAIRKDPDGTITRGRFDASGDFIPELRSGKGNQDVPRKTTRITGHGQEPSSKTPKPRARASVKRLTEHA